MPALVVRQAHHEGHCNEFNVESGFTGLDTEKFRLPGKDEYKAPRNFREEILESLKQGVPPQMKDQIERYFKNLSE